MKKHYTIIDIAKELGISKSTVSRAFNDRYDVKPETRKAVLDLAAKMNFHPNPNAANLVSRQTKMIGIVVPEFVNSFFPKIIIPIQDTLAKNGYNVLITQSNENPEIESENLRMLIQNRVDGILISPCRGDINAGQYEQIINNGTPLVFFSRDCPSVKASRVSVDDYRLAHEATGKLIDGIAASSGAMMMHLKGPDYLPSSEKRYNGWKDALEDYKFNPDNHIVITSDGITIEDGLRVMQKWILKNPGVIPQCIFAFNDPIAIGAMKAIKNAGYRIPDAVRIMGFSESKSALIVDPPLSSVAQPLEEMGITAATLLLDKLKNPKSPDKNIILAGKVNLRESTSLNS